MTAVTSTVTDPALAALLTGLGGIPLERVRCRPDQGRATEEDVLRLEEREHRLCELVDGVIVEKPMGIRESLLALALGAALREFVHGRNLGIVSGPDGMLRLAAGLVRIPDVAFISWSRIPGRKIPEASIPDLAPDLAVEILGRTNTAEEMARKRREYFQAGVSAVWMIDPDARTVTVYTAVDQSTTYGARDTLDGGSLLPGFVLPLASLFAELDREPS